VRIKAGDKGLPAITKWMGLMATIKKVILNVLGTDGNDTIQNTGAVEMIQGGFGIDKVIFEEGTKGINVNLATGKVTDSFGNKETISGVEIVIGTSFNDIIIGSANADYLIGNGGDDKLSGGAGSDELYGGTGNDTMNGGADSDYMVGGAGNDAINGGAGFDLVDYSDEGGTSGVTVNLTTKAATDTYGGTDTLTSVERIRGTELVDSLTGNSVANMFEGGAGNDMLDGAGGDDILWAGFGDDMVIGGTGHDQLVGGRGFDTLNGGRGIDTVDYSLDAGWHGVAVNLMTGLAEDTWGDTDTLIAVENLVGSEFADWFMGNGSANSLTAGAGDDIMTGGAGADTFVFGAGHGHDKINDYVAGDMLDLRGLGFTSAADVVAASAGHELGAVINTGEGSSIVLVDVNISSLGNLSYIFA
jgi:Ca2+-binding RTX toxin-like protein